MRTIDLTPKWAEILPALLTIIEAGTPEGRKFAIKELGRMAALADAHVSFLKETHHEA